VNENETVPVRDRARRRLREIWRWVLRRPAGRLVDSDEAHRRLLDGMPGRDEPAEPDRDDPGWFAAVRGLDKRAKIRPVHEVTPDLVREVHRSGVPLILRRHGWFVAVVLPVDAERINEMIMEAIADEDDELIDRLDAQADDTGTELG